MIQWTGEYRPKIGDLIYAQPAQASAEQALRDAMERMGFPQAQSWSAGDCMAAAIAADAEFIAQASAEPSTADLMRPWGESVSSAISTPDKIDIGSAIIAFGRSVYRVAVGAGKGDAA